MEKSNTFLISDRYSKHAVLPNFTLGVWEGAGLYRCMSLNSVHNTGESTTWQLDTQHWQCVSLLPSPTAPERKTDRQTAETERGRERATAHPQRDESHWPSLSCRHTHTQLHSTQAAHAFCMAVPVRGHSGLCIEKRSWKWERESSVLPIPTRGSCQHTSTPLPAYIKTLII